MERMLRSRTARRIALPAILVLLAAAASSVPALDAPSDVDLGTRFSDIQAFKDAVTRDGDTVESMGAGELSGIGPATVALISHSDTFKQQRIVVLASDADGGLSVHARSQLGDVNDVSTSVRLERGSLFVGLDGPSGATGVYQFKEEVGRGLRLIGVRLHRADSSGADMETTAMVDTDFNVITGNMLFKRMGDSRPLKAQVHGPGCYLNQFDFGFYFCATDMKTAGGTTAETLMNTP